MKKRTIALLMAVVLLFGTVAGGTIAYLTTKSKVVTNTFTVGDINIILDETDTDNSKTEVTPDSNPVRDIANKYDLIPGNTYVKDPKVTVEAGSESCYIFVKVEESKNTLNGGKIIQYTVDETNWLPTTTAGIYRYKDVVNLAEEEDDFQTPSVLVTTNEKNITINTALTKDNMPEANETPVLIFKACAVQSANLTPEQALEQAVFAN